MKRTIFFTLMSLPFLAHSAEKFHLNSKIEMNAKPATQIELGEKTSTKTALYFGLLAPNQEKAMVDLNLEMKYLYTRLDYYMNGAFQQGLYTGLIINYSEVEYSYLEQKQEKISGAGIGIQVGYTWNMKNMTIGTSVKAHDYSYGRIQDIEKKEETAELTLPHHQAVSGSINLGYRF